jgi:hypothetical protein
MRRQVTLEKIEKEMEMLKTEDQLKLVEKLIHQLRKSDLAGKRALDWSNLYGLGKGLWVGEDAQEYVNHLREDRA